MAKRDKGIEKPLHEEFAEEMAGVEDLSSDENIVIGDIRQRINNINMQLVELQKNKDAVSKKVLLEIADNINTSLGFINEIDRTAQEVVSKEDEIKEVILKLTNQNRLDEANNIKDMALMKYYRFFEKVVSEHRLLRNELMQLQNKIRQS